MPHEYRFADDVVFKEVSNRGVLLSQRSGQYRQVNPTGTRVLRLLADGGTWESVLEHMVQQYPQVEVSELSRDLSQMLEDLAENGVLVRV